MTKKRLADLEESKTGLASQIKSLKDQLGKYESSAQMNRKFIEAQEEQKYSASKLEKEIENLKVELTKSKTHETHGEIVRTIEKYEREKDILADHNQVELTLPLIYRLLFY